MGSDTAFETAASVLEQSTTLDRLEARGTIRLALKEAGFDARSVRTAELRVVVETLLPRELSARGIDAPTSVVERLVSALASVDDAASTEDSPESVFNRLGGGAS